jgi:hypothetical protein
MAVGKRTFINDDLLIVFADAVVTQELATAGAGSAIILSVELLGF